MHNIIIDTDPGIDDAQAIAFAIAHPDINLMGLTTVFGNADVELTTRNALTVLEHFGAPQVPVAKGAGAPLQMERYPAPDFVHGKDGMGNLNLDPPSGQAIAQTAAEFIVEMANKRPDTITLIAIGPLTNIALALRLDPQLPSKVKSLIVMGGTVAAPGNVSPVAEANFLNDPHAADLVCGEDWPLTIIGLDVTMQIHLTDSHLMTLNERAGAMGELLWQSSRFYVGFYSDVLTDTQPAGSQPNSPEQNSASSSEPACAMHDASAVIYAVRPDLFTTTAGAARVAESGIAQGQLILDRGRDYFLPHWQNRPDVHAAMYVDDQAVLAEFVDTIVQHADR